MPKFTPRSHAFASIAPLLTALTLVQAATAADTITWKQATLPDQSVVRYALVTPTTDKHDPTQPTPTLLALPPGSQDESMVVAGLSRYWAEEAAKRGWIVISPTAPTGKPFHTAQGEQIITGLLDAVSKDINFQGGRVHLAGVSNGGRSAFHLAVNAPERFHSVLTLPGGADGADAAKLNNAIDLPIHMFVGAQDESWARLAKDTQARLLKAGAPADRVTLEELEGQGHLVDVSPARLFDLLDADHVDAMSRIAESQAHIAVVELFTSEGCSSCPPADDVLVKLNTQRSNANSSNSKPGLMLLSFHVDYWDRLGWPDRFASHAYTSRQEQYSRAFSARGLYTPQTVVNGQAEFVGSDAARTDREVSSALGAIAPARLSFRLARSATPTTPNSSRKPSNSNTPLTIEVLTPDAQLGDVINAAIVEDGLVSDVKAGENSGRKLHHDRVVRTFESVQAKPGRASTLRLKLPSDADRSKCSIIVYTQQRKSMAITAAAQLDLHE